MVDGSGNKACPFCAEEIQADAQVCVHCKADLNKPAHQAFVGQPANESEKAE